MLTGTTKCIEVLSHSLISQAKRILFACVEEASSMCNETFSFASVSYVRSLFIAMLQCVRRTRFGFVLYYVRGLSIAMLQCVRRTRFCFVLYLVFVELRKRQVTRSRARTRRYLTRRKILNSLLRWGGAIGNSLMNSSVFGLRDSEILEKNWD